MYLPYFGRKLKSLSKLDTSDNKIVNAFPSDRLVKLLVVCKGMSLCISPGSIAISRRCYWSTTGQTESTQDIWTTHDVRHERLCTNIFNYRSVYMYIVLGNKIYFRFLNFIKYLLN